MTFRVVSEFRVQELEFLEDALRAAEMEAATCIPVELIAENDAVSLVIRRWEGDE